MARFGDRKSGDFQPPALYSRLRQGIRLSRPPKGIAARLKSRLAAPYFVTIGSRHVFAPVAQGSKTSLPPIFPRLARRFKFLTGLIAPGHGSLAGADAKNAFLRLPFATVMPRTVSPERERVKKGIVSEHTYNNARRANVKAEVLRKCAYNLDRARRARDRLPEIRSGPGIKTAVI